MCVCNEPCRSPLDLGKDPLVRGRQVVEIRQTLTEPRALTDPVRTSGHTMELRQRDACWKQANGIYIFLNQLYMSSEVPFSNAFCVNKHKYLH